MAASMNRRSALKGIAGLGAAAGVGSLAASAEATASTQLKGHIKQSVTSWQYDMSVDELASAASEIGLVGIDYLPPSDWSALEEHGLICTMAQGPEQTNTSTGFNHTENHEWLIPGYRTRIQETAEAGYENVIAFSGQAQGLSDEQGLKNCAAGLREVVPVAEEHDVTICMEYLNSKVDHPDYQFDNMAWGLELVDRVGSENFKILFDIYHVQIMEGDIIRKIRDHNDAIGHYHTAGVPGRNEINDTQELNYPAIMRAILETDYQGYVGQEFIPTGDPVATLREAAEICDVALS